jgi:hypothetical protein
MPVLILAISEDFDELLENGILAALTALRKFCRIMVMAVHVAFVLIIAIFSSELCRADGAGEMLDMILPVQSGDVGTSKSTTTRMAEEI